MRPGVFDVFSGMLKNCASSKITLILTRECIVKKSGLIALSVIGLIGVGAAAFWAGTQHQGNAISPTLGTAPNLPPPAEVYSGVMDNKLVLSWPAVEGAASYNIYRAEAHSVTQGGSTQIRAESSATVMPVEPGKTYYIVVTSVNDQGESLASGEIRVVNPAAADSAPAMAQAAPDAQTAQAQTGHKPTQEEIEKARKVYATVSAASDKVWDEAYAKQGMSRGITQDGINANATISALPYNAAQTH
jgi:hypothetical protein